jgi:anion-transporting  ArsA/GET3 family ATPase
MPASSQILVFCGKGGVGKTTLSLAFALREAAAGRRVLLVTAHTLDDLATSISLDGLPARFPQAAANLFIIHIDPREVIAEQVRVHFPIRAVAEAVLKSATFRNLIEIAPGLKEMYFLSRMQSLAERRAEASEYPSYDLLVWDAPATGHFLSMLKTGRDFETFLSGPLASVGADASRFFSRAEHMRVFPVTTLEEMALAETVDLADDLQRTFGLVCSTVLINAASPVCTATDEEMAGLPTKSTDAALRFAIDHGLVERERVIELKRRLPIAQTIIPRITNRPTDIDLLLGIGERLNLPGAA